MNHPGASTDRREELRELSHGLIEGHQELPVRLDDETAMDTPMLDPSWTPVAGYGHAHGLMSAL